jgi:aryl-alcohol dehydrogenase-like predicted oxidoreductase
MQSVSIAGAAGAQARAWYRETQLPVLAYSPLAHGLFSGKMPAAETAHADRYLDKFALRGYAGPANFQRLRRCEELAARKGAAVAQVALAWIFRQGLDLFAVVSASSPRRMESNIAALSLPLTPEECRYLNLEDDPPEAGKEA